MATDETKKVSDSTHEDPNFAIICSFISKYGSFLGLSDISFEHLEKWIDDQRSNDSLRGILLRLLKRWKSSVNEERFDRYLIRFCHTFSQVDAWEVERFGFEKCNFATKLRILKNLLEQQFDVNAKFKEKINEIPASELRCLPVGRDVDGKAYWVFMDPDMNIRVYSEEQDDIEKETWQIVVNSRTQLVNLILSLEKQREVREQSRSGSPSTVNSETTDGLPCSESKSSDVVEEKNSETKSDLTNNRLDTIKEEADTPDDLKDTPAVHEYSCSILPQTKSESSEVNAELSDVKPSEIKLKFSNKSVKVCSNDLNKEPLDSESSVTTIKVEPLKDEVEVKQELKQESKQESKQDEQKADVDQVSGKNQENIENSNNGIPAEGEVTLEKANKNNVEENGTIVLTEEMKDNAEVSLINKSSKESKCNDDTNDDVTKVVEKNEISASEPSVSFDTDVTKSSSLTEEGINLNESTSNIPAEKSSGSPKMTDVSEMTIKNSGKRKWVASNARQSSSEDGQSESDLSETASDSKCQSGAEEPPSKRKRDKALINRSKRNRRSGRSALKELPVNDAEQENKKIAETDKADAVQVESNGQDCKSDEALVDIKKETTPCDGEGEVKVNGVEEKSDKNEVELETEAKNDKTGGKKTKRRGRTARNLVGKKKREHKITEAGEEAEYEPNNKMGRPEGEGKRRKPAKDDEEDEIPLSQLKNGCVSEEDVPLMELRRSSRANKGMRKFEQLVVEEPKKRKKISEAQLEKERKIAEKEERRRKKEEQEQLEQELAAKQKKKRRGRNNSDDDFIPGSKKSVQKTKGRKKRGETDEDDEQTEEDELEDELFEPESEEELKFDSSSSSEELESDGSVYEPHGRNAKRAATLKEIAEVTANDMCCKCGKGNHPELILLCDACDGGYHTACLRPPLFIVPDGDWFCPPCEHKTLIEKLQEHLAEFDKKAKQNHRLMQRKERLAFVGISLSNVISQKDKRSVGDNIPDREFFSDEGDDDEDGEGKEDGEEEAKCGEESAEESEEDSDDSERKRRRKRQQQRGGRQNAGRRQQQRRVNRRLLSTSSEDDRNTRSSESDKGSEDSEENWLTTRRSRRQHKEISYKFEEFDNMINVAIEDDVKEVQGAGNYGRGKDMANITGVVDNDDSEVPSGHKRKKRRNLTKLDSNDEEEQDEESEEYQVSEDDVTSASAEETLDADEDTDDWDIASRPAWGRKTRTRGSSKKSKRSRKRRSAYDDDFVVDEYDSDEGQACRRTRRKAAQRTINYQEDTDDTEVSHSSQLPAKKKPPQKRILYLDQSDEDVGNKKNRKNTKDDSDYNPSADEEILKVKTKSRKAEEEESESEMDSDNDYSSESSDGKKKGKGKNVIYSDEEEEEKEKEEKEESESPKGKTIEEDDSEKSKDSVVSPKPVDSENEERTASDTFPCKTALNGRRNLSDSPAIANGNVELQNNHNFTIANFLKHCDKQSGGTPKSDDKGPMSNGGREDSITDILDLVDYVTKDEEEAS